MEVFQTGTRSLAQSRTDNPMECKSTGQYVSQGCLAGYHRWLDFDRILNWESSRKGVTWGPRNINNRALGEAHWQHA